MSEEPTKLIKNMAKEIIECCDREAKEQAKLIKRMKKEIIKCWDREAEIMNAETAKLWSKEQKEFYKNASHDYHVFVANREFPEEHPDEKSEHED